jgi:hypothetical protein
MRRIRILNRTPIRSRRGRLNLLARHGLFERETDVISRAGNVLQVGRRLVVDGAVVDHDALGINYDHLRRCLGIVEVADSAGWVEQRSGRRGLHLCQVVVLGAGGHVSLVAQP